MLGLLLAIAAAPLLHVDPARDVGLPCAAHASLRARLETLDPGAQAGTRDAADSQSGDRDSLEARLAPGADGWSLQLSRADGTAALTRALRLPADASGCALAAESAALIVDRYLAALRDPSRQPGLGAVHQARAASVTVAEAPAQATIEGRRGAPVSETPRVKTDNRDRAHETKKIASNSSPRATPHADPIAPHADANSGNPALGMIGSDSRIASALPVPPRETPIQDPLRPVIPQPDEPVRDSLQPAQLNLSAGPGALLGLSNDLRFAFWIEAEHPVSFLSTRMLLIATTPSAQTAYVGNDPRGHLSAQSFLLALSAGPCFELWARTCALGFAGARATLGSAGGDGLYHTQHQLLTQPEFGAQINFSRPLLPRLSLGLSLLAGAVPGSGTLTVEGGSSRSLPNLDTSAALLVDYQLF